MSEKGNWNSFEVTKLGISLLTPLLIFWLGYIVSNAVQNTERALQEIEKEKEQIRINQLAIQNFSRFIYERRARAELLTSSLTRNVSIEEIKERKKLYDEAYFNWNSNHQANLLIVRKVLGDQEYSEFESLIEFHLVKNIFIPLDRCLTEAYDLRLNNGNPTPVLASCEAKKLLQRSLDCGYALTDELFKLTYPENHETKREKANSVISSRCNN